MVVAKVKFSDYLWISFTPVNLYAERPSSSMGPR